jgi:uncharacterized protein YecE (DUF72 family)
LTSIKIFVGTSGWLYDWNLEGTFDWYVRESGLNAVELNASFYRLPFRNQVVSWARKSGYIRWAVKIHRYITHYARLSDKAVVFWRRFREIFAPLDEKIDYYLLQLPPSYSYSEKSLSRLKSFIEKAGVDGRIAVEFRHPSWFSFNKEKLCEELGEAIPVSVDAPGFKYYVCCKKVVYLRLHGRTSWYFHEYTENELREIVDEIVGFKPRAIYVFFNNNHWMLENARLMKSILEENAEKFAHDWDVV